jgi:hypothetical protein
MYSNGEFVCSDWPFRKSRCRSSSIANATKITFSRPFASSHLVVMILRVQYGSLYSSSSACRMNSRHSVSTSKHQPLWTGPGVNHLFGQGLEFATWSEVLEEVLLVPELNFSEVIKGRCALMRRRVGSRADELRISPATLYVPASKKGKRVTSVG